MSLRIPELSPNVSTLTAGMAYAKAGGYLVPIRHGTKHPGSVLGADWQHKSSREPELIAAWLAGTDHGIALHAGRSGAVVFDVDHPERLPDTLQRAISECRPPFQSTRTNVAGKGHYVFAMPEGRILGNGVGRLGGAFGEVRGANGVIVVAPTPHPDAAIGGHYVWGSFGPVPVLPDYVADLLDDASPSEDAATDAEVEAFLESHSSSTRPKLLTGWCTTFTDKATAGESRHQRMVSVAAGAMKEAAAGYFPARDAAKRLHDAFVAAVALPPLPGGHQRAARTGGIAEAEWSGILAWAIAQASAADPGQTRARVNEKMPKVDTATGEVLDDDAEATFWSARDELGRIKAYALAHRASPWATLIVVLTRVIAMIPATVVLPKLIGGYASLNLFGGLVGVSGGGKGAAVAAGTDAVHLGLNPGFDVHTLGSGQGIAHAYMRREEGQVVQYATSALFIVEEVDLLAQQSRQTGGTLLAEMRRLYMAERLGHLYVDPAKRMPVPTHAYRAGVLVQIQPARAGVILDDSDGGLPQRFLWASTIYPQPDVKPNAPDPVRWEIPEPVKEARGRRLELHVCRTAVEAIDAAALARSRGDGDPLDGHRLLCREKAAAALGFLAGHAGITEQDWRLAEIVMNVSDLGRQMCVDAIAAKSSEVNRRQAEAEATRTVIIGDRVEEEATQRVARALLRILSAAGDWVPRGVLRHKLAQRDRARFDEVAERLILAGQIEVERVPGTGQPGDRYKAVGEGK
jgi:Bifunctional DNA primase/polymerase, N-terminal